MPRYEVYATRWDDPHIIEELIPARGLEFTMPLSDTGECSFSATVEPGRSFWRPAIAPLVSGVLVCRDDVPVWSGMVWAESQSGPRTFDFQGAEWGSAFERVPAVAKTYTGVNDHAIFRDIVDQAQAIDGQGFRVTHANPASAGRYSSDLTINTWDDLMADGAFRQVANAEGGPRWYFGTAGTLADPVRTLVLFDDPGIGDPLAVLEYVEATEDYEPPSAPPELTLLGNLFPGDHRPVDAGGNRRGGNVIAHPARRLDGTQSATVAVAIGAGEEKAQLRRSAVSGLIGTGFYPRLTRTQQYNDVTNANTLQRHADADLKAVEGLVRSFTLTTLDDDPDWTQVPRGSTVRVLIDSDVYGAERPVEFLAQVEGIAVQVPDNGLAQVNWTISTTLQT